MRRGAHLAAALAWRDLQLAFSHRAPFLFDVLGALGALALYFFIGRFVQPTFDSGGLGFFAFATSGIAILRLQAALTKVVLNLERDQASGTLELSLIAPARPGAFAVGVCLYELVRAAVFACLVLLASRFVFGAGLTLGPRAWPGLACGLLGALLFFVLLVALVASVLVALRQGSAFAGLLALALPVLSGAFFPPSLLPQPLELAADVLPLTMAVELIRDAIVEASFAPDAALVMFAILVLALPLALLVFEATVERARLLGTLGHQ